MPSSGRKLLVTTDLSPASELASERAEQIASPDDALTLLYVVDFTTQLPGGALTLTKTARAKIWDEVRMKAQPHLDGLRERKLGRHPSVETAVVDGHGIAHTICEYAREHQNDLILIAAHGRSGPGHHWLGSVAERVVRLAPCDVLVVRPLRARDPASKGD